MAPSSAGGNSLVPRIATSIVGVSLVLGSIWAGGIVFTGMVALSVIVAAREYVNLIRPGDAAVMAVLGLFYLGLFPLSLPAVYTLPNGRVLVAAIFVAVWVADTSAYAVGRLIGRHKLAPKISPNKTIEGAAGSLALTALLFWSFPVAALGWGTKRAVFGLALAIMALAGDLFESWLKRRAGVKDSGDILPGHGGLLDRIDSLLFAAPTGYLLLRFWI